MKVYIASSWKNERVCSTLADYFRLKGIETYCFCDHDVYRFWWPDVTTSDDDAITGLQAAESIKVFETDKRGLDWADCCVLVVPSGRDSHLEAGYIKGKGGKLYIIGDFPTGEFSIMYHLADGLFRSSELEKLINFLAPSDKEE